MDIATFLNLSKLLEQTAESPEHNRAFGLKHKGCTPVQQLVAWEHAHRNNLMQPLPGEQFASGLYRLSVILGVISLVLGLFTGVGLLQYNGHAPVNIIYFLAVAVGVPIVTIVFTLLSMLWVHRSQNPLIHLSPAFWMERLVGIFFPKISGLSKDFSLTPPLFNWLVIQRTQMLSLLFSLGLLFALLGVVSTTDIAFAWRTTLQIEPEAFHRFLSIVASPWQSWLPTAVPSLELIEQSHYFRLGEKLDSQMLAHASHLGEWWKFLACSTLFYAVFLRLILWILATWGLHRALKEALLHLNGVDHLLYEMRTPLVASGASAPEDRSVPNKNHYCKSISALAPYYPVALGWAMTTEELAVMQDSMGIEIGKSYSVGGIHTLEEDTYIISQCSAEVLLYVKGWEPPVMDLIDFLEALSAHTERILLYPIGTAQEGYRLSPQDLEIWERKLQSVTIPKVWLYNAYSVSGENPDDLRGRT